MKILAIAFALFAAGSTAAADDDPLAAARDLYASAAYEEALSELARLKSDAGEQATALELDAYRSFCLLALGRNKEAETIAESLVRRDPMFTIDWYNDVSPRIAEMFAAVRKGLLPQLIRAEYRAARASAIQDASDRASRLARVQAMLSEARKIDAWDDTLADLSLLVDGFLDLSRRPQTAAESTAASASSSPDSSSVPAAAPVVRSVFDAQDSDVVPPMVLFEAKPVMPIGVIDHATRLNRTCLIQVLIDEQGTVANVIVRQSVNSAYDSRVVDTARKWKYKPATRNGAPVKYVKVIAITPND